MKNKGITLITLVITIVMLIILAGLAITLSLGSNGLITRAREAKEKTQKATATEEMNLKITNIQIDIYAKEDRMPTLQEISNSLCEDEEIEYVELQSKKIGSLEKIDVGNASSIFTKLKEYPYEFEINSSLQLASINGIEINNREEDNSTEENNKMGISAYVIGNIVTYSTNAANSAAFGYSSNNNYFTCGGSTDRNYLLVNIRKDMNILVTMQESGRGNSTTVTTHVNNVLVNSAALNLNEGNTYKIKVNAGDVIKITQERLSGSVRGLAIRNILRRLRIIGWQ